MAIHIGPNHQPHRHTRPGRMDGIITAIVLDRNSHKRPTYREQKHVLSPFLSELREYVSVCLSMCSCNKCCLIKILYVQRLDDGVRQGRKDTVRLSPYYVYFSFYYGFGNGFIALGLPCHGLPAYVYVSLHLCMSKQAIQRMYILFKP